MPQIGVKTWGGFGKVVRSMEKSAPGCFTLGVTSLPQVIASGVMRRLVTPEAMTCHRRPQLELHPSALLATPARVD